jgi:hypothetical protein
MTGTVDSGPRPTSVPVTLTPNGDRLSYRQAREAPCLSCTTSPCCTYLLLGDFKLQRLLDIDHALYLLNFDGIMLGLDQEGKVDIYFYQPCGYLDVPSGLCTVHSTPLQPAVCVQYNAHSCGYRHRITADVDPERPMLDPQRMTWLAERMEFDDDRRVIATPEWDEILEGFRQLPLHRSPAPPPEPDPIREEWRSIVLSEKGPGDDVRPHHRHGDWEVSDPCSGCAAWCCKRLVFNRGIPADASQLEFLRYCLGFPGVEVGVAADSWAVIVSTTCRHLDGNRCSVFGTDQRPLKCSYYDAMSCGYRRHFGTPRPDDIVRVSRDQFGLIADSIVFDDVGRIVAIPPIEIFRDRLETAERKKAGRATGPHSAAGSVADGPGAVAPGPRTEPDPLVPPAGQHFG